MTLNEELTDWISKNAKHKYVQAQFLQMCEFENLEVIIPPASDLPTC